MEWNPQKTLEYNITKQGDHPYSARQGEKRKGEKINISNSSVCKKARGSLSAHPPSRQDDFSCLASYNDTSSSDCGYLGWSDVY